MKYQDYLKLNEDEGVGGEVTVSTGGDFDGDVDFGNEVPKEEPETPSTNITDNMAGYAMPILYTRLNMPQIPKEMKVLMRDDLKLNGHNTTKKKKKCSELVPMQSEFNDAKVNAIHQDIVKGKYEPEPILVSADNKIVDGHHRWKAVSKANEQIDVEQVSLTFDELFKFFENKPYVVKRDV